MNIGKDQTVDQHLSGLAVARGNSLLDCADIASHHDQKFTGAKRLTDQKRHIGAFEHGITQFHAFGDAG